jgi:hypothetical protein
MSGNNSSADPIVLITVGLTAVVLLAVFQISRSIGADFQSTLSAFMPSLLIILGAGLGIWKVNLPLLPMGSFVMVLVWPCWWKVLDSIGNAGSNPDQFQLHLGDELWWTTTAFKWGVEIVLIVLCGFLWYRHQKNNY